jgi:hypothetical protein
MASIYRRNKEMSLSRTVGVSAALVFILIFTVRSYADDSSRFTYKDSYYNTENSITEEHGGLTSGKIEIASMAAAGGGISPSGIQSVDLDEYIHGKQGKKDAEP